MRTARAAMALAAVAVWALAACGPADAPPVVENAWVRAGPPGAGMLAGYLSLVNPGREPVVLTAVDSGSFARIELHRTLMEDGMARMRPEASVTVPAGGRVEFEPNGRHLMLHEPLRPLAPGDTVVLGLHFADGTTLDVAAVVRQSAGDPHAGHRH